MSKSQACEMDGRPQRRNKRKRKPPSEEKTTIVDENVDYNSNRLPRLTDKQTAQDSSLKKPRKGRQKKTNQKTDCVKELDCVVSSSGREEIHESRSFVPEFNAEFFKTQFCEPIVKPSNPIGLGHDSFTHFLYNKSLGVRISKKQCQSISAPLVSVVSDLQLYRMASPFDRRCTALDWHPKNPDIIAAGSKGGDIIILNKESTNKDLFTQGIGAGGSVQALKFWPNSDTHLLTASIDGRVMLQDIEGKKSTVVSDTLNCMDSWYCSVDVSAKQNVILTGDNVGHTLLLSPEGKQLWSHRLHKNKVTHVEWSPREDWLFCTASCDQMVKFWDVRMIKGRQSSLIDLKHTKPVNSAYFSLTDGCRLLTTDQKNEIRVYSAPSWSLETTILHPHRFFQHITPFKAHWHPLQDLVVVGRYPDPNFQENDSRTIDIFEAPSGGLLCQLEDPCLSGLISLNRFSPTGDCLASAMGCNILVWNRKEEVQQKQERLMAELKAKGFSANNGLVGRQRSGQGQPRSYTKQTKTKSTGTRTKSQTKLKTKQTKR